MPTGFPHDSVHVHWLYALSSISFPHVPAAFCVLRWPCHTARKSPSGSTLLLCSTQTHTRTISEDDDDDDDGDDDDDA